MWMLSDFTAWVLPQSDSSLTLTLRLCRSAQSVRESKTRKTPLDASLSTVLLSKGPHSNSGGPLFPVQLIRKGQGLAKLWFLTQFHLSDVLRDSEYYLQNIPRTFGLFLWTLHLSGEDRRI